MTVVTDEGGNYRGPWIEVRACARSIVSASQKGTPIWKIEASLKMPIIPGRYAPPVHMIRLTEQRQTTPYVWVLADEER